MLDNSLSNIFGIWEHGIYGFIVLRKAMEYPICSKKCQNVLSTPNQQDRLV